MFQEPSLFDGGDDGSFVPFTDILLNVLMGFAIMVFIAFALIRPEMLTGDVEIDAEYLITMTWPDNNPDDIDLYVEDPGGNIVWYNVPEGGFLALERDDRGNYRDSRPGDGQGRGRHGGCGKEGGGKRQAKHRDLPESGYWRGQPAQWSANETMRAARSAWRSRCARRPATRSRPSTTCPGSSSTRTTSAPTTSRRPSSP